MAFGLTSLGFIKKQLTDLKSELEQAFRDAFGAGIKTTPDTNFGKIIGIITERYDQLWALGEAIYNANYPNSASGVSLARIGEITAIAPNAATKSTSVIYLAGTDTTLIPAGSLISTQDANDQFEILSDINLSGSNFAVAGITRSGTTVSVNAIGHGQPVDAYIFINDVDQPEYNGLHQVSVVVGVDDFEYEIATAPTTPATGTITADPTTVGNAQAVNTGPAQALSGTLTQIVTPVSGWTKVENALDATLGANAETDAAFRIRRNAAILGSGSATLNSIRGALLTLANVTQVKAFENVTDVTDANGRLPHSVEAIVQGGTEQDILDEIFDKKAAGIRTLGTTSGTVTDSQGDDHTVKFSRPGSALIYLELDLTVDANYPIDGDAQVTDAVLAYGVGLEIGDDVIVFPTLVASFAHVPGITDVVVRIDDAPAPTTDDNVIIADNDLALFDSSRITITQV